MASITPINTATDTPSSAATKTNANELAINTELETNTIAIGLNTAKTGITTDQANDIIANNAKNTDINHVTLELPNVDNTSDANKPVSTAGQAALDLKADKTSVLELDNTTAFTPDADYEPATKKYVDDNAGGGSTSLVVVSKTSSQTLFSGYAVVVLDNESIDRDSNFASNVFTVPVTGDYIINLALPMSNTTASGNVEIRKNSVQLQEDSWGDGLATINNIFSFESGDTVDFRINASGGGSGSVSINSGLKSKLATYSI